jgi:hypothetical protein
MEPGTPIKIALIGTFLLVCFALIVTKMLYGRFVTFSVAHESQFLIGSRVSIFQ